MAPRVSLCSQLWLTKLSKVLAQEGGLYQWLWSHLFAEAASVTVAIASMRAASTFTADTFLLMAASICGSSACYYTILLVNAWTQAQRTLPVQRVEIMWLSLARTARTMILDYGSVELLDALVFSPLLLYTFLQLLPNRQVAVVASEIVGTLAFYLTLHGIRVTRRTWTPRHGLHDVPVTKTRWDAISPNNTSLRTIGPLV